MEAEKKNTAAVRLFGVDIPIPVLTDDGTRPVFLYRKKLKESDAKANQNRLLLTKSEKLMEFLTEKEREVVVADDNKKGIEIVGVDSQGKPYKLHLKKWPTSKMPVLKKDWTKLVLANNASKGDWIELWGFRSNGQLRLAVHFRKPAAAEEAQRDAEEGPSQLGG